MKAKLIWSGPQTYQDEEIWITHHCSPELTSSANVCPVGYLLPRLPSLAAPAIDCLSGLFPSCIYATVRAYLGLSVYVNLVRQLLVLTAHTLSSCFAICHVMLGTHHSVCLQDVKFWNLIVRKFMHPGLLSIINKSAFLQPSYPLARM